MSSVYKSKGKTSKLVELWLEQIHKMDAKLAHAYAMDKDRRGRLIHRPRTRNGLRLSFTDDSAADYLGKRNRLADLAEVNETGKEYYERLGEETLQNAYASAQ